MGAVAQYLLYRIREALEYMMGAWSLQQNPQVPCSYAEALEIQLHGHGKDGVRNGPQHDEYCQLKADVSILPNDIEHCVTFFLNYITLFINPITLFEYCKTIF